ncbi:hypothetical protein GEV33_014253 [Tenebrio molitor]|uniref:Uncharacterized protein n=1 Tax=Tenebrio molitor TaxID=7067 RepID=A0A8J6L7A6_TENMO|nr:hypothetical protein GEV33_014253 [Tenebrio molitor]
MYCSSTKVEYATDIRRIHSILDVQHEPKLVHDIQPQDEIVNYVRHYNPVDDLNTSQLESYIGFSENSSCFSAIRQRLASLYRVAPVSTVIVHVVPFMRLSTNKLSFLLFSCETETTLGLLGIQLARAPEC